MLSPKLRHRILIERIDQARDSVGGVVETWVTYADKVPAEVVPLSGREFVAAAAVQAGVSTRITVRYDAGIREDMRVRHDGRIYNIKAILPDPSLRRHLALMAESVERE